MHLFNLSSKLVMFNLVSQVRAHTCNHVHYQTMYVCPNCMYCRTELGVLNDVQVCNFD